MRPLRVELEGFMAYRQPTTLDLSGADFFSLTGPTGSGKSSLIDAMIFALYGRVPRLGARAVAPVISSGADRARVLVEFESAAVTYTVVRSVKRTATGAHTDEVRLQTGADVLASGAESVTAAVEGVLSLGFDDFTKTVVLPQGEFARFLISTPGQRQDLLRNLLAYDFSGMRELAVTRVGVAKTRVAETEGKLGALNIPEEETIRLARSRLAALDSLAGTIVEREEKLEDLAKSADAAKAHAERISDAIDRLATIAPPADIDRLEQAVMDGRHRLDQATLSHERTLSQLEEAETAQERLPTEETIRTEQKRYEKLANVTMRMEQVGSDESAQTLRSLQDAHRAIEEEKEALRLDTEALNTRYAAHAVREHLEVGKPCPVCAQIVTEITEAESPDGLSELQNRDSDVTDRLERLRGDLDRAREAAAADKATRAQLVEQRKELEEELEGVPTRDSLVDTLLAVEAANLLLGKRKKAVEVAAAAVKTASSQLESSAEALSSVGRDLMAARGKIADLEPPIPASDDPVVQWKELMTWCDRTRQKAVAGLAEAHSRAEEAAQTVDEANQAVIADLEAAEIEPTTPYSVAVTRTQAQVQQIVGSMEEAIVTAAELRETIERCQEQAAIGESLASHLKVSGFEKWLMAGAFADLVTGANGLLEQLAAGGFSLASSDDGSFDVIDHRNADEARPVSTLSGGETFLVSLALALSLAETLSGSSGAELNAVFLDEGFGTLDEESLDTVASVLEDLAGKGLMVGVVSHVKELASRAPVRFEVRRAAGSSYVELVS